MSGRGADQPAPRAGTLQALWGRVQGGRGRGRGAAAGRGLAGLSVPPVNTAATMAQQAHNQAAPAANRAPLSPTSAPTSPAPKRRNLGQGGDNDEGQVAAPPPAAGPGPAAGPDPSTRPGPAAGPPPPAEPFARKLPAQLPPVRGSPGSNEPTGNREWERPNYNNSSAKGPEPKLVKTAYTFLLTAIAATSAAAGAALLLSGAGPSAIPASPATAPAQSPAEFVAEANRGLEMLKAMYKANGYKALVAFFSPAEYAQSFNFGSNTCRGLHSVNTIAASLKNADGTPAPYMMIGEATKARTQTAALMSMCPSPTLNGMPKGVESALVNSYGMAGSTLVRDDFNVVRIYDDPDIWRFLHQVAYQLKMYEDAGVLTWAFSSPTFGTPEFRRVLTLAYRYACGEFINGVSNIDDGFGDVRADVEAMCTRLHIPADELSDRAVRAITAPVFDANAGGAVDNVWEFARLVRVFLVPVALGTGLALSAAWKLVQKASITAIHTRFQRFSEGDHEISAVINGQEHTAMVPSFILKQSVTHSTDGKPVAAKIYLYGPVWDHRGVRRGKRKEIVEFGKPATFFADCTSDTCKNKGPGCAAGLNVKFTFEEAVTAVRGRHDQWLTSEEAKFRARVTAGLARAGERVQQREQLMLQHHTAAQQQLQQGGGPQPQGGPQQQPEGGPQQQAAEVQDEEQGEEEGEAESEVEMDLEELD